MIYSLPNGRDIELSLEQYLAMSDDDFHYLIANQMGEPISDPFHGSALYGGGLHLEEIDLDEFSDEDYRDLTLITDEEKLMDEDFALRDDV
jgi:hypothetical protein